MFFSFILLFWQCSELIQLVFFSIFEHVLSRVSNVMDIMTQVLIFFNQMECFCFESIPDKTKKISPPSNLLKKLATKVSQNLLIEA